MSDDVRALVPFGKYKGQPVEVLSQDAAYCEWLTRQDWFRSRFSSIHTLIVNNFAEAKETPEHNALQALFTDDAWVLKFLRQRLLAIGTQLRKTVIGLVQEKAAKATADLVQHEQRFTRIPAPSIYDIKYLDETKANETLVNERCDLFLEWLETAQPKTRFNVVFEQGGVDVCIAGAVQFFIPDGTVKLAGIDGLIRGFSHSIECKPVLGDDYPAVLRQMQASGADVLFIGAGGYAGVGATFVQVQKIFRSARIEIVLLSDVPS